MVTKAFAMSGGLYTYQVALGHSFVLRRAHHLGAYYLKTLRKPNYVMWCGQMARRVVASMSGPVS
jgi:hypothetical protein